MCCVIELSNSAQEVQDACNVNIIMIAKQALAIIVNLWLLSFLPFCFALYNLGCE